MRNTETYNTLQKPEILFRAIDALGVRRVSSYPHQGDSLGPAGTAHDTPSLTAAQ